MPIPSSGAIRMGADIGLETGNTATAQISLGATIPRTIANIPSGAIRCAADFYNKSYSVYNLWVNGQNNYGDLGLGDTVVRSIPVQLGTRNWTSVDAGNYHVLGIRSDGTLWGWGRNNVVAGPFTTYVGVLGVGNTVITDYSSPVQIGTSTNWKSLSVAINSAVITNDNALWVWGPEGMLLGIGSTVGRSAPVQVGTLNNWKQVHMGNGYSVAVKTDGTLWAWGFGNAATGLNNTTTNYSSPVQVGTLTDWDQVYAARPTGNHTVAIKTNRTLWAWGPNFQGQLGDGTTTTRSSPVQIGTLSNWSKVSVGNSFTVATKTDGTLWTWGLNDVGQLGDGTTVNKSSPIQIGTLSNWSFVDCGERYTSAIKTDGTLWFWGSGLGNVAGDGTTVNRSSPIQIGTLSNWVSVSSGGYFTNTTGKFTLSR